VIDGVTNADSIPTLERLVQFAGARHRLITNNIANLSTPNFRPVDVSVDEFRAALRDAVETKRASGGVPEGPLQVEDTSQIRFHEDGLELDPAPSGDNILFHDGNDRNLERIMQDMVENFMAFRQASELIRNRYELINTAIREHI